MSQRQGEWTGAVALFGVGDVMTTAVGLSVGAGEVGPLAAHAIEGLGLPGMVMLKILTIAGFYILFRIVPEPYNVGVPLGLTTLGLFVVVWNTAIIILLTSGGV